MSRSSMRVGGAAPLLLAIVACGGAQVTPPRPLIPAPPPGVAADVARRVAGMHDTLAECLADVRTDTRRVVVEVLIAPSGVVLQATPMGVAFGMPEVPGAVGA